MQLEAIRCTWELVTRASIGCHREQSEAIVSNQKQWESIRSNQVHSEAIRYNQQPSEAIGSNQSTLLLMPRPSTTSLNRSVADTSARQRTDFSWPYSTCA